MKDNAIKLLELQCQIFAELRQFVGQLDGQQYIKVHDPKFSWMNFSQESIGVLSGYRFQVDLVAMRDAVNAIAWTLNLHFDNGKWLISGFVSHHSSQEGESVEELSQQETDSVDEMSELALQMLTQLFQHTTWEQSPIANSE